MPHIALISQPFGLTASPESGGSYEKEKSSPDFLGEDCRHLIWGIFYFVKRFLALSMNAVMFLAAMKMNTAMTITTSTLNHVLFL